MTAHLCVRTYAVLIALIFLLSAEGFAQETRPRALADLISSSRDTTDKVAAGLVRECPVEARSLTLDIIFYRWASDRLGRESEISASGKALDSLVNALDDPTVDWASAYFAVGRRDLTEAPILDKSNTEIKRLQDLKTFFKESLEYEKKLPIEAINSLQRSANICSEMGMELSGALISEIQGDHASRMGDFYEAERRYDEAAWDFSVYNIMRRSATIHEKWGVLAEETDRLADAAEHFENAARQWQELADRRATDLDERLRAGKMYMRAGEVKWTINEYDEAIELMTGYGVKENRLWSHAKKDYEPLIMSLARAASYLRKRNDTQRAKDLLREALKACEPQSDDLLTAYIWDQLAQTYTVAGDDKDVGIANARKMSALWKAVRAGTAAIEKLERNNLAAREMKNVLADVEDGAQAYENMRNFDNAAELWEKAAKYYEKASMPRDRVRCLRSLAKIYDDEMMPEKALEVRSEAVSIAMGDGDKTLAAAIVEDMIDAFLKSNDTQNALEALTELSPIVEASGNVRGAARVLEAKGTMLMNIGQYADAAHNFALARAKYLSQMGNVWDAGKVSVLLAEAQSGDMRPDEAIDTLKSAIGYIEESSGYENTGARSVYRRVRVIVDLYTELAASYVQQNRENEAVELVTRARDRSWYADLIKSVRENQVLAPVVQDIENTAQRENGEDVELVVEEEEVLATTPGAFAKSCWVIESNYRDDYAALPFDPLDIMRARKEIPPGSAIVAYMPVDSAVYVFVCAYDTTVCKKMAVSRGQLDASVRELGRSVREFEERLAAGIPVPPMRTWKESAFTEIGKPLSDLYKQLLQPVIGDLTRGTKLIFAMPDGLDSVPVHALVSKMENGRPRFVVHDYSVSYLSRGMLVSLTDGQGLINGRKHRMVVFADPQDNLPGAREEWIKIKNVYPNSAAYIGKDATSQAFLEECAEADIIHLAAHHETSANLAMFQLELAGAQGSDGSLGVEQLADIFNPGLELVTLSACNTSGTSESISSGPARAAEVFSLMGARSVVGGLWKVSDEAASKLMESFYSNLNKGKSRAESLRFAEIDLIDSGDYSHPVYWAGFALYGNPD